MTDTEKSLNFDEYGAENDRMLLILHGLFGWAGNWKSYGRHFAEAGLHVVIPDMRNHGASFHSPVMNYEAMSEDIAALLGGLPRKAFILMGHSMGGKAAMTFALQKNMPLMERLIVLDIAPLGYDSMSFYSKLKNALFSINTQQLKSKPEALPQLQAAQISDSLAQFLLTNLVPAEQGGFKWRVNLDAIFASMQDIIGFPAQERNASSLPLAKPVSFVGGEKSDYITQEGRDAAARLFPQAEFFSVPNAGHWLHADNRPGFLNAVTPLLSL